LLGLLSIPALHAWAPQPMVTPGLDQSRGQVFQIPVCGRSGSSFETLLTQLLRISRTTAAFEIAAPSVRLAFGVSVATEPSLPDAP